MSLRALRIFLRFGAVFWVPAFHVETTVESAGTEFGILVGTVLIVLGLLLVYALRRVISAQGEDQATVAMAIQMDSCEAIKNW